MQFHEPYKIAILGAGAWGSALAIYLSRKEFQVCLWSHNAKQVTEMLRDRINAQYLPGHIFPNEITITNHFLEALYFANDIIIAVPSVAYREVLQQVSLLLTGQQRFLSATKGMDHSQQLLHETFIEIIGKNYPFGIISGPSFAQELAAGLPTSLVLASCDANFSNDMQKVLQSKVLNIELSTDLIGVGISGIVKNVLAIATGILDGMNLGANARSTLLTKGFNELVMLANAMGANINTCMGISGIGDLILTCTNDLSRNRRFGLALGKGQDFHQTLLNIGQAVEGASNAQLISQLAYKYDICLPICAAVTSVVKNEIPPKEAILNLFNHKFFST